MFNFAAEIFRPPLTAWWPAALAAVIVAASVMLYLRRDPGAHAVSRGVMAAVRVAALLAIVWVLMGPTLLKHAPDQPANNRPALWILADTSASMATRDMAHLGLNQSREGDAARHSLNGHLSRWQALRQTWLSDETLDSLAHQTHMRLLGFNDSAGGLSRSGLPTLTPHGSSTRLFDALNQLAHDDAPASNRPTILLLSDGHDTRRAADDAVLDRLRKQGRPVFVVPVGSTRATPHLALQAWADADFLFVGQPTTIHAAILQHGYDHARVRVELLDDKGRVIQHRDVSFKSRPSVRVEFKVTPQARPGRQVTMGAYRVRVALQSPELNLSESSLGWDGRPARQLQKDGRDGRPTNFSESAPDLTRFVFLQVSRQRIRVALFEGEPYWDTRYLARVLERDPQIHLTAVFAVGEHRQLRLDSTDTAAPAKTLADYDVVILGKGAQRFFPGEAATKLVDYVRKHGGTLVLARGEPFDLTTSTGRAAQRILAPIEPVTWGDQVVDGLKLELTPSGRQAGLFSSSGSTPTNVILTHLPGMIAATRIENEKAASIVLLRQAPEGGGDTSPFARGLTQERRDSPIPDSMAAISTLHAGRGQVLAVLTDGLWRWAMLPSDLEQYDSMYDLFWSRTVRWLAAGEQFLPGQQVSLSLDRLAIEPGQTVRATIATRYVESKGFSPTLEALGPDGSRQSLHPQRDAQHPQQFHASFTPKHSGVYRLVLKAPGLPRLIDPDEPIVARLAVYDRSLERADTSARPDVLKQIARRTGSQALGLHDVPRLLAHLKRVKEARTADAKPVYNFARPWVLAVIVGGLGIEWFMRRRRGLP